jgi:uncharacterized delta-60 repeat protein
MIAGPPRVGTLKPGLALAVLLAALLVPALAQAAKPGDLDRSFGDGGKMVRHFCTHPRSGQVVIDRHGRIVFAGSNNNQTEFCVARYRRNGRPDRSFSGNGKVRTDFGGAVAARAVAVDSHGRIVVAGGYGRFHGQLTSVALARYKPDGRLDRSFSGDGKTTMPFGGAYMGDRCESSCHDHARSVAIDLRDRIIVAGGSFHDFALARYRGNGSLDGSFGIGGRVHTDFGGNDVARSVAIDSGGRIVATGDHPDDYFALARYEPNGDLDGSFGDGGKVDTNFGSPALHSRSMAIDSGGRIVVGGERNAAHEQFFLARYEPDGDLDRSFGDGGKVITGFGPGPDREGANSVAIDSRNRIVAGGGGFRLARYKPNGRLDGSFSGNGKVSNDWGADAHSVAIDSRDRIVAMGWHSHLVLARYHG